MQSLIPLLQSRQDMVVLRDARCHIPADICRFLRPGGDGARRQPCQLIRAHAERARGVHRRRIPLELSKGGKVQTDNTDDEDE